MTICAANQETLEELESEVPESEELEVDGELQFDTELEVFGDGESGINIAELEIEESIMKTDGKNKVSFSKYWLLSKLKLQCCYNSGH